MKERFYEFIQHTTKRDRIIWGIGLFLTLATIFFTLNYLFNLKLNNSSKYEQILSSEPVKMFSLSDTPIFKISLEEIGLGTKDIEITLKKGTLKQKGRDMGIEITKLKKEDGSFEISLKSLENFRPGKYQLIVEGDKKTMSEDFLWGVLTINTNKSVYVTNDDVLIQITDLGQNRNNVCSGIIKLEVLDPNGRVTELSMDSSPICNKNKTDNTNNTDVTNTTNFTNSSDYLTHFKATELGKYTVTLTNLEFNYKTTVEFKVEKNPLFSIERVGSTRVNSNKKDSFLKGLFRKKH